MRAAIYGGTDITNAGIATLAVGCPCLSSLVLSGSGQLSDVRSLARSRSSLKSEYSPAFSAHRHLPEFSLNTVEGSEYLAFADATG